MSTSCFKCNTELDLEYYGTKIMRSDECTYCGALLRCCFMCHFYSKSSYNDCAEPNADRIIEKDKPNFCDYFKFADNNAKKSSNSDLLNAAEALFKKK